MIILPPEEKKSHPVAKWLFRLLVAVVCLIGSFLFVLNVLSGTSDSHKKGLEGAMSDLFQLQVRIGKLETFNLFPQFLLEMHNVQGEGATGERVFYADKIRFAFAFTELFGAKDEIEELNISNLFLQSGVMGPRDLLFRDLEIVPAVGSESPFLKAEGTYGPARFSGTLDLHPVPQRVRPSYQFARHDALAVHFGPFTLTGKLAPDAKKLQTIENAVLSLNGEKVASGLARLQPVDKKAGIYAEFKTAEETGQVLIVPKDQTYDWTLSTLDLNSVLGTAPLWARLGKAWQDLLQVSVQTKDAPAAAHISLNIAALTGALEGTGLKGRFISAPDAVTGWWTGAFSRLPAREGVPGSARLACGLIQLKPHNDIWTAEPMLTLLDEVTVKSTLTVPDASGIVHYATERVAQGTTTFGADLAALQAQSGPLQLSQAAGCNDLVKSAAAAP